MISDNVEFLPPIFYAVFWQPFWKFWKCRIAPLMVTYHYVKFYVSIVIHVSMADLRNYWTEFHEIWWSYRYMFLVGPKVFSFVVQGVKVIFWGVQRGGLTTGLNEHFALWQILSLIFCGIVVAILKMETGRNFAMSGINSGHHNLPTYEISLKSFGANLTFILRPI
jgi:hypothetical protein